MNFSLSFPNGRAKKLPQTRLSPQTDALTRSVTPFHYTETEGTKFFPHARVAPALFKVYIERLSGKNGR